jgi:hypothetical protein
MKATIVEIHKDYCITITKDGQFLKEKIPAGMHEIGDEIIIVQPVIEKSGEQPRIFQIVSRTAIGFAALAVIVIGSYFGVQYFRTDTPSTELAMVPEEKAQEVRSTVTDDSFFEAEGGSGVETAIADEATGEESISEEVMAAEEDEVVETALKALQELFSGTFSLEQMDTEIMIESDAMFVSYRVDEMKDQDILSEEEKLKELTLKFKNMKEDSLFDGNADILMLHSDMTVSEIEKILLENLNYNQQNTKKIPFSEETNFQLVVFGIFK